MLQECSIVPIGLGMYIHSASLILYLDPPLIIYVVNHLALVVVSEGVYLQHVLVCGGECVMDAGMIVENVIRIVKQESPDVVLSVYQDVADFLAVDDLVPWESSVLDGV